MWEYRKEVFFTGAYNTTNLVSELNLLGEEGWEAISIQSVGVTKDCYGDEVEVKHIVYLKRKK